MVSKGDHDKLGTMLSDNHRVRKPFEYKAFCTALAGNAWHRCQGNNLVFQKIKRCFDSLLEFEAQALALALVPRRGFRCLKPGTDHGFALD
jgi:hypothetical protein